MALPVECIEVDCTDCGSEVWDSGDNDGKPHFPAVRGTRGAIDTLVADYEWSVDLGVLLCPTCRQKRSCLVAGHDWTPWGEPFNGQRMRFCGRCPEYAVEDVGVDV